jgi:flagellar hook-associated protein 3 FlgL
MSTMRVDPSYMSNMASALDLVQSNAQQLSSELSSGVRVTSLSQDPVSAGENVLLLNQMQQDDSFTQSANLVTGQLQVADSALGQTVTQLNQAVSLATSANNGTMNSSDLQSISNQLAGIRSEVISLGNSNYQGQYIFAGSRSSSAPFSLSGGNPATVTYNGDEDVSYLETPGGQKIQLNVPGDQIFSGNGTNNVFAALNNLIADYATGASTTKAVADTTALGTALNYVSQQRVTIDNSITQISSASDAVSSQQTQLTTAQTNLMQADVAQISTQLSTTETQQTALEDMMAQLDSNATLFDKLPPG